MHSFFQRNIMKKRGEKKRKEGIYFSLLSFLMEEWKGYTYKLREEEIIWKCKVWSFRLEVFIINNSIKLQTRKDFYWKFFGANNNNNQKKEKEKEGYGRTISTWPICVWPSPFPMSWHTSRMHWRPKDNSLLRLLLTPLLCEGSEPFPTQPSLPLGHKVVLEKNYCEMLR